ncbi:MAG TPA: DUF6247 family protein [Gemmatimonadales bacterium]|nr:DUF6247 family protein [Gemmatimonadales bacterium]
MFKVLLNALTDEGLAAFQRDLLQAIQRAQQRNNLRPVREVLESWYRTLVVRQDPDFEASLTWARQSKDRDGITTVDELMRELGR